MAAFDGLVLGLALGVLGVAVPGVMLVAYMVIVADRRQEERRPAAPVAYVDARQYHDHRRTVVVAAPAYQGYIAGAPGPMVAAGLLTANGEEGEEVYAPMLRRRLPAGEVVEHETLR